MDFEVELISFERQPHWQNEEPDKKIRHAGKACPSLQRLAQAFWRWLHRVQALQGCAMQNVCRISADLYATCLKGECFVKACNLCASVKRITLCNSYLQSVLTSNFVLRVSMAQAPSLCLLCLAA